MAEACEACMMDRNGCVSVSTIACIPPAHPHALPPAAPTPRHAVLCKSEQRTSHHTYIHSYQYVSAHNSHRHAVRNKKKFIKKKSKKAYSIVALSIVHYWIVDLHVAQTTQDGTTRLESSRSVLSALSCHTTRHDISAAHTYCVQYRYSVVVIRWRRVRACVRAFMRGVKALPGPGRGLRGRVVGVW